MTNRKRTGIGKNTYFLLILDMGLLNVNIARRKQKVTHTIPICAKRTSKQKRGIL